LNNFKIKGYTKNVRFITDRCRFTDETGKIKRKKENCSLPSSSFNWTSDWEIDFSTEGGVDLEGWQYAFDVI
jgi:hypothetical protein